MNRVAIYNPYIQSKGGGEKMCLALAEALAESQSNEITIITHGEIDLVDLAAYFQLDLSRIKVSVIKTDSLFLKLVSKLPLPSMARNFFFDVKILRSLKKANFEVFINFCYQSNMPSPAKVGVYMCMFPQKLNNTDAQIGLIKKTYLTFMHALYRFAMHPHKKYAVQTYDHIISISEFTRSYVKKYWGEESSILYPISDDMRLNTPPKKEKIILNVGRFFENAGNNHHKRQDILLEAFTELSILQKSGWQLHFAGSVAEDVGALKYIMKLMKQSQNMPVYFHFNCTFDELKKLYNQATIYWHATGFGSDADTLPERQEHFGISTVEAMSTGSIPVVINTAGQKETVINNINGFLWDTIDELKSSSTKVAGLNADDLKKFQTEAKNSATRFNKDAFNNRIQTIFDEIFEKF